MSTKVTTQTIISKDEFIQLTRPIIGLRINRVWRGYSTAIFLEIGKLHKMLRQRANGEIKTSIVGEFTVMLQWSWRVERARSVYFSGNSSLRIVENRLLKLNGQTVRGVDSEGRLPELVLQLSNGYWVHSFEMSEGQQSWALFLHNRQVPLTWLSSERGKLILEKNLPKK